MQDERIMEHIEELVEEEQRLYGKGDLDAAERSRLEEIQVELDQYWDLLRQRRARREFGQDPDAAQLRDEDTVEGYEN